MRVGWAGVLLSVVLAGCGRDGTAAWDESEAPDPGRQVRVLAPSGRLAPPGWQIEGRVEGRHIPTTSQTLGTPVAIFDWPEEAVSVEIFAPGCVPLTLGPPQAVTTFARLEPGPAVRVEVREIPALGEDVAGLYLTLTGNRPSVGTHNAWTPISMASTVLQQERGFSTAGALVPADGRMQLHVPVPGRYYAAWTVERRNARSSFQDSRGTLIDVVEGGTDEVVVLKVPAYVGAKR